MIKAIVTDIEGTTSSISFVHDVLFPYARARMAQFVREHATEPQVAAQLAAVSEVCGSDMDLEGIIAQLLAWIDQDQKATPLKALQGMIWQQGYRDGDFHGHVYGDAYENLRKWHARGIKQYVYSSGSVQAQKLLFGHTEYGDLTTLFNGYFDTNVGAKTETQSYQRIVEQLHCPAEQVLFLSDIQAELDAAKAAGVRTCWLVRAAEPDVNAAHMQVADFDAVTSRMQLV
jgi:enolase-phosphatase E1